MPLVRISIPQGKGPEYGRAVGDAVHQAMVETAAVPSADRFQIITEEPSHGLVVDPTYLGINRTADSLIVQITLNFGRSLEVKRKLYARIAELVGEKVGLRKEDVMVSLVEVPPENWSFGNGEAQYGDRARPAIKRLQPDALLRHPGFSQVVEVAAPRTVFISGQVAIDVEGKLIGRGDIVAQTEQVFTNLQAALKAANLGFEHIVKITSFLADMRDLEGYRKVRSRFLSAEALPVSTTVQARMVDDGFLVEGEAVAVGA